MTRNIRRIAFTLMLGVANAQSALACVEEPQIVAKSEVCKAACALCAATRDERACAVCATACAFSL